MSVSLTGAGLALLSAACFAGSNVFVSKSAARTSDDRGVLLSIVFTFALSSLAWLIVEGARTGAETGNIWLSGVGWYALSGLFSVVLGRKFLYASLRRLGVTRGSAVKRLNPFFSVLLAFLLLGETISALDGLGMALVACAFAILIQRSFSMRGDGSSGIEPRPVDYLWGVASALAYATSYIARKQGLDTVAAPAFGTMISALAGLLIFGAAAIVVPARRADIRTLFVGIDRWIVGAGMCISSGQILLFAALFYESISTVVMISSLETFISVFLSVVVFRTEVRPDFRIVSAAVLATLGVIAVAAG